MWEAAESTLVSRDSIERNGSTRRNPPVFTGEDGHIHLLRGGREYRLRGDEWDRKTRNGEGWSSVWNPVTLFRNDSAIGALDH
ncbi:MAG: hypothetical protein J4432_02165 [DPANN group archaeon]|nr:hypothetical protein [DPANN group archaeon]